MDVVLQAESRPCLKYVNKYVFTFVFNLKYSTGLLYIYLTVDILLKQEMTAHDLCLLSLRFVFFFFCIFFKG